MDRCPCGRPLHYTDPATAAFVREMIRRFGDTVKVTAVGRTWRVPRHYLALHGLTAAELPMLGFPEVTEPSSR
jgi:hypothetical protein